MSYEKATKHARNVRKTRKQGRMHFGFSTGSGAWTVPPDKECVDCKYYKRSIYFDADGRCERCQQLTNAT